MARLEALVEYVDGYLGVPGHPDYRTALNGLQVDGPREIRRVGAAVDVSEAVIAEAAELEVDLLLVHHGLFWGGLQPLTGRHFRKVQRLISSGIAVYAAHLPLDAHPEVGNCALLARALGVEPAERFGSFEGSPIGWSGASPVEDRDALVQRLAEVEDGPVTLLGGGPERVNRVAVVTGGGGSFIEEAARSGVDTLVTGEGSHHTFVDAHELGVNVLYGGHYATETFGVKALASHLARMFDLEWLFLHHPSGL